MGTPSHGLDDSRVLAKVRALLAKAESTPFEAEAEALSAKAQELMARHSIDHALVEAGAEAGAGDVAAPIGHRIDVGAPYVAAKVLLLSEVASANRSRSVWSRDLGFCTVFGFGGDVQATELLYTSLLVQADTAMRAAGSVRDRAGRSRTRSFRRSFLLGFATRIGERLRAATDATTQQAEHDLGTSLLPVLRSRLARVEDAAAAEFPDQVRRTAYARSHAGFHAGQRAADQASVDIGRSSLAG